MTSATHSSRLFVLAGVCACVALLLSGLRGGRVLELWQANIKGLAIAEALVRNEPLDQMLLEDPLRGVCADYVTTIATVHSAEFRSLASQQQLDLLQRIGNCWPFDRHTMLLVWTVNADWAFGRFRDVCETLVAIDAPYKLLELAQASADAGDWEAVEVALECVNRYPRRGAWVSPFIVAPLYHALGQHFERVGIADKAIAAYDAAARWYPVVWAEPYLEKADLLWKQGTRQAAIAWLVDGLAHSTDVTASFNLWRGLGYYWQQLGDMQNAACAYINAARLADEVPAENLTAAGREEFLAQVAQVSSMPREGCFSQYPKLQAWQPNQ